MLLMCKLGACADNQCETTSCMTIDVTITRYSPTSHVCMLSHEASSKVHIAWSVSCTFLRETVALTTSFAEVQ